MTIKRLLVKYYHFIDSTRKRVEDKVEDRYLVRVFLTNGHFVFNFGWGSKDVEYPIWKVFYKMYFSKGASLPSNWEEIARDTAVTALGINDAARMMEMDVLDIPQKFIDYTNEYRRGYDEWLSENAEDPYYM